MTSKSGDASKTRTRFRASKAGPRFEGRLFHEMMTSIRLVYRLRPELWKTKSVNESLSKFVEERVNGLSQIEFSYIVRIDGVIWDDLLDEDEFA